MSSDVCTRCWGLLPGRTQPLVQTRPIVGDDPLGYTPRALSSGRARHHAEIGQGSPRCPCQKPLPLLDEVGIRAFRRRAGGRRAPLGTGVVSLYYFRGCRGSVGLPYVKSLGATGRGSHSGQTVVLEVVHLASQTGGDRQQPHPGIHCSEVGAPILVQRTSASGGRSIGSGCSPSGECTEPEAGR